MSDSQDDSITQTEEASNLQTGLPEAETSVESSSESEENPPQMTHPSDEEQGQKTSLRPWVDYIPACTYVPPTELRGKLEHFIQDLQEMLSDMEKLKLSYVDRKIHKSYYKSWVDQSNRIFINIVRLKTRLALLPPQE